MHRGAQEAEAGRALGEFAALADTPEAARAELERHVGATPGRTADAVRALGALLDRALAAARESGSARDAGPADGGGTAPGGLADLVFLDVGIGGGDDRRGAGAAADAPVPLASGFEPTTLDAPAAAPSATRPAAPAPAAAALDRRAHVRPPDVELPALRFAATLPGEPAPMTVAWLDAPGGAEASADAASGTGLVFLDDAAPVAVLDVEELPADSPADAALADEFAGAPTAVLDFLAVDDGPSLELAVPPLGGASVEPLDLTLPEPESGWAPSAAATPPPAAAPGAGEEHIDLGDWLRAEEPEVTTRMTAAAPRQTEDENAAFAEALRAFKAGVARAVPDADFDSHYDSDRLQGDGAARRGDRRAAEGGARPGAPAARARGARPVLRRSRRARPGPGRAGIGGQRPRGGRGADDASAVGVCYLLATACERLGRVAEARRWFVRVLAIDFTFRDAAARLASLPAPD
jgi:hypothetical protein